MTVRLVLLGVVAAGRLAGQGGGWSATPAAPTVGDTIWLERTLTVPNGWQVRPGKLDATEAIEPLADPAVRRSGAGWEVRYAVVAWKPGIHKLALPSVWLLGPSARVARAAARRAPGPGAAARWTGAGRRAPRRGRGRAAAGAPSRRTATSSSSGT